MWVEWCWPSWCSALACFVHRLVSRRAGVQVSSSPSYAVAFEGCTQPIRLCRQDAWQGTFVTCTDLWVVDLAVSLESFCSFFFLMAHFLTWPLGEGSIFDWRLCFLPVIWDVFYRGCIPWAFIFIVSFWTLRIKVLSRTGSFPAVLPLNTYILWTELRQPA